MKKSDFKVLRSLAGDRKGLLLKGYLEALVDRAGNARSEEWEYIKDTPDNRDLLLRAKAFEMERDPADEEFQADYLITGPVDHYGIGIDIGTLASYFIFLIGEDADA